MYFVLVPSPRKYKCSPVQRYVCLQNNFFSQFNHFPPLYLNPLNIFSASSTANLLSYKSSKASNSSGKLAYVTG